MFSIKKIEKKYRWLFILPLILLLVIVLLFKNMAADTMLKNKEQYLHKVRPQLVKVTQDPSRENISQTQEFLYNIKSSDRSIGDYHLPLYMVFTLWLKYADSRDLSAASKAIGILEELKVRLPELSEELDNLIFSIKNHV